MMNRSGFTLIEVSVAGSLIAFTVLTALAIIPYGLRTQNEARMRTVAAATVMYLGSFPGESVNNKLTADGAILGTITRWEGRSIIPWKPGDSAPVSGLLVSSVTFPPGNLARRLVYSVQTGTARAITVWLLSKDPASTDPKTATYLTTFSEAL